MGPQYYTVTQAAEILQKDANTIRVKIREGKIPVHPLDGEPRIPKEYLDNWDVNSNETFRERKLRQEIELKDQMIQDLKNKIRKITRIGLEVEL